MYIRIRRLMCGVGVLLGAVVIGPVLLLTQGVAHAIDVTPGTCQQVHLPVAFAPHQPTTQVIQGTLCSPIWWHGPRAVDVLVHGATYNSTYWNWPIDTELYSYTNDTLLAGRAVFTYDALGAGQSSHPVSTAITIDAQGFVLHQVLEWLHDQPHYARLEVIGHSLGSITAVNEASRFHDEDALVLTGYSHAINPVGSAHLASTLYSASHDPQFSGKGLDMGYLTSQPGTRQQTVYSQVAQPDIVAYDETHKDVVSATELGQGIEQTQVPALANISNRITVPVLELIGQEDSIFCGVGAVVDCTADRAVRAFDAPFFTHTPSFAVRTIPLTGHDLALHPTNPLVFLIANHWLETH